MILVVDDDPRIARVLTRLFSMEGYGSRCASSGREGLEMFDADSPDAVILDLGLPDMRGQEICQVMKNLSPETPVIILTAISDVAERAALLKMGADDYVTKPFSPKELLAGVQAALRRSRRTRRRHRIVFGNVEVDFASMQVTKDGRPVTLTAHEFNLLRFFLDNPQRIITRDELLKEVWGGNEDRDTRVVDNQILKLRRKLEDNPENPVHFCTVYRGGYRFRATP
jgi:DNA-binding response OmpR family regulator